MTLQDLAASYQETADTLQERIAALEDELRNASKYDQGKLMQRIHDLKLMYGDVKRTAVALKYYYDKDRYPRNKHQ